MIQVHNSKIVKTSISSLLTYQVETPFLLYRLALRKLETPNVQYIQYNNLKITTITFDGTEIKLFRKNIWLDFSIFIQMFNQSTKQNVREN